MVASIADPLDPICSHPRWTRLNLVELGQHLPHGTSNFVHTTEAPGLNIQHLTPVQPSHFP